MRLEQAARLNDPVLLEILRTRFQAIAEEMATVTLRTAHTVFVKETGDFGSCLTNPRGETFAAPSSVSVSHMIGRPAWVTIDAAAPYQPGDVGITNDPVLTKGLSTHLPDIWLWKPIFSRGEIVAFAFSFVHSSDVGGKVPGSISPTSTELYQEGLRIPQSKLFEAGKLNRELRDLILLNCRIPEQNWGDIKAQIASLNVAERRLHELIDRYGHDPVRQGIEDLIDRGEERARAHIGAMPDGRYEFADYMEGDVAGGRPIRIKLALEVAGRELRLDFTGTDPEVQAALNLPTWNQPGHYSVCIAFLNYLRTIEPDVPYTSGLVRPIRLHIPEGTLLNPSPQAAVGVRAATMLRVIDCLSACLGQAVPDVFPAASAGAASIVLLSLMDATSGARRVGVLQPLLGGSGARPTLDGVDGTSFTGGWLRNIPNEMLEADLPILIEEYGYRPNSAAAGRWRGGSALHFRVRSFAPEAVLTARGLERFTFRPFGLRGGKPGALGRARLNPGTPQERDLGKLDLLVLGAGDVVEFDTASGGAFGEPFAREPELVLADVAAGLIDAAAAEADYGVVVRDGALDPAATEQARLARRPAAEEEPFFDGGPERAAYEARWPSWLQEELTEVVLSYPNALRPWLQRRLVERLDESVPERGRVANLARNLLYELRLDALR
jgi:N-methylhydantoinase B